HNDITLTEQGSSTHIPETFKAIKSPSLNVLEEERRRVHQRCASHMSSVSLTSESPGAHSRSSQQQHLVSHCSYTLARMHTHSHTHTHTHAHTHTNTYLNKHSHTHKHILRQTFTYKQTLALCFKLVCVCHELRKSRRKTQ